MSRNDCNNCPACNNGKCDKCGCKVCIDNMEMHKEIFKLKDEFNFKVYFALSNLIEICHQIKNNLLENYGINIEISNIYNKVLQCDDFLTNMKIKSEELKILNNIINNEMIDVKKNKNNEIINLNKIHEENINEANKKFDEEIKQYKIIEAKYKKEFKSKSEEINNLIKIKKEMDIDIKSIIKEFVDNEKIKAEKDFNIQKK